MSRFMTIVLSLGSIAVAIGSTLQMIDAGLARRQVEADHEPPEGWRFGLFLVYLAFGWHGRSLREEGFDEGEWHRRNAELQGWMWIVLGSYCAAYVGVFTLIAGLPAL